MRAELCFKNAADLQVFVNCQGLSELGYEVVSTGGSASAIEAAGVPVQRVEELTGFPEMLDGAPLHYSFLDSRARTECSLRIYSNLDTHEGINDHAELHCLEASCACGAQAE